MTTDSSSGENVATTEVATAMMAAEAGVEECNVYGVTVPGMEGRAGAAAVRARQGQQVDLARLYAHCTATLAHYARPVFVRVLEGAMEVTTTFKHRKIELVKDGFDPTQATRVPIPLPNVAGFVSEASHSDFLMMNPRRRSARMFSISGMMPRSATGPSMPNSSVTSVAAGADCNRYT